jgi:hypothetical protein
LGDGQTAFGIDRPNQFSILGGSFGFKLRVFKTHNRVILAACLSTFIIAPWCGLVSVLEKIKKNMA